MPADLKKIYEESVKEKKEIITLLEPLRKKEAVALKRVDEARAVLKVIREEIVKIEKQTGLAVISMTIAKLAPRNRKLNS